MKPGAQIKKGQSIIELETGKAVAPIPSPAAGTVTNVRVKEGDKLSVGGVILSLEEAAGATSTTTAATCGRKENAETCCEESSGGTGTGRGRASGVQRGRDRE